jgi:hypothetical protein
MIKVGASNGVSGEKHKLEYDFKLLVSSEMNIPGNIYEHKILKG